MHRERIKIVNAKQAKLYNNFRNTKCKLIRTNAAIWFNKMCKIKQVKPGYIHIKINGRKQQDKKTTKQAIRYRIDQEIKFLYRKQQHINQKLYNIHLECNGMWQYVQHNIDSKLKTYMDLLYKKLNRKLDVLTQHIRIDNKHKEHTQMGNNRVINMTNITFTKEQINTLKLGPQYAIEKNPKQYINELIIDTENAIRHLQNNTKRVQIHGRQKDKTNKSPTDIILCIKDTNTA